MSKNINNELLHKKKKQLINITKLTSVVNIYLKTIKVFIVSHSHIMIIDREQKAVRTKNICEI